MEAKEFFNIISDCAKTEIIDGALNVVIDVRKLYLKLSKLLSEDGSVLGDIELDGGFVV